MKVQVTQYPNEGEKVPQHLGESVIFPASKWGVQVPQYSIVLLTTQMSFHKLLCSGLCTVAEPEPPFFLVEPEPKFEAAPAPHEKGEKIEKLL